MSEISIAINLDTRSGFMEKESVIGKMSHGTRSLDYFTDGILNKIKFFDEYDKEITLFIDVHDPLPEAIEKDLLIMQKEGTIDNLIFNKHTEKYLGTYYPKWLDMSILDTLILCRGKYLVHFDADMAAFINDKSVISEWLEWLNTSKYDYISYPSRWSPSPDVDKNWDYFWASTRFFICKRDTIDYTETIKCLGDSGYLYSKYGDKYRQCPWLEHVLGIIAGPGKVFYPPIESNRYMIFSWSRYVSGVLKKLNEMPYSEVLKYVAEKCGGLSWPCDVGAREI